VVVYEMDAPWDNVKPREEHLHISLGSSPGQSAYDNHFGLFLAPCNACTSTFAARRNYPSDIWPVHTTRRNVPSARRKKMGGPLRLKSRAKAGSIGRRGNAGKAQAFMITAVTRANMHNRRDERARETETHTPVEGS